MGQAGEHRAAAHELGWVHDGGHGWREGRSGDRCCPVEAPPRDRPVGGCRVHGPVCLHEERVGAAAVGCVAGTAAGSGRVAAGEWRRESGSGGRRWRSGRLQCTTCSGGGGGGGHPKRLQTVYMTCSFGEMPAGSGGRCPCTGRPRPDSSALRSWSAQRVRRGGSAHRGPLGNRGRPAGCQPRRPDTAAVGRWPAVMRL